ncbi:GyrI-like domain-containing protein [Metabacillus sp. JX24]|uniref:GyrI-like domain-containing protein n=1 Tax=Metabacillus sp. JX24 TaxID=3240759 RepID=UPI00350F5A79
MKRVRKTFKAAGMHGFGAFADFGSEVPELAGKFLKQLKTIGCEPATEAAFYEPKRDDQHLEGYFFAGMLVDDQHPENMERLEMQEQDYVTVRGSLGQIADLHRELSAWALEQGYERDLEAYIVETYHPAENGEEVEIYLPVRGQRTVDKNT